jgi:HAD superfamily hydrolase (TIGR01509 family)
MPPFKMSRKMTNTTILKRSCWIFDLDGTLTIPKHDFPLIRRELGVPDDQDILGYLASLSKEESGPLHEWLYDHELDIAKQTEPAMGVERMMNTLHQRGARLGIFTRNTKSLARVSVEVIGLGSYFPESHILGRDEAPPKPEPDGICQLLHHWSAAPSDAVMVGDYLFDLQSGQKAGTATIHVDTTRQFAWPEITDLGVGDLVELCDLMAKE